MSDDNATMPVAWRYKERINCGQGQFVESDWKLSSFRPQLGGSSDGGCSSGITDMQSLCLCSEPVAAPRPEPVAWVATSPLGTQLHMGKADGWSVEPVLTLSEKDWHKPMGVVMNEPFAAPAVPPELVNALADLEATLCDPDGNVAIGGSMEDLRIIHAALDVLRRFCAGTGHERR
jgi:hypothetical protein